MEARKVLKEGYMARMKKLVRTSPGTKPFHRKIFETSYIYRETRILIATQKIQMLKQIYKLKIPVESRII